MHVMGLVSYIPLLFTTINSIISLDEEEEEENRRYYLNVCTE